MNRKTERESLWCVILLNNCIWDIMTQKLKAFTGERNDEYEESNLFTYGSQQGSTA